MTDARSPNDIVGAGGGAGSPEEIATGITMRWLGLHRNEITIRNEIATAIRDARARALDEQWQPIETAPKDGRFVDLWHKQQGRLADCRWFKNGSGYVAWHAQSGGRAWNMGDDSAFSHWAPLPAPPRSLKAQP